MKKTKEPTYVVVYGTLLEGEKNAHWAGDAKRIPTTIKGKLWDTGYGFPAFEPDPCGIVVEAEVLVSDEAGLEQMDRLEGYPRLYRREEVRVKIAPTQWVYAWVYVMNKLPREATIISSGSWRRR